MELYNIKSESAVILTALSLTKHMCYHMCYHTFFLLEDSLICTPNLKITRDIKIPFILDGIYRVDDTPVHKAMREALVNCLVNADYFLPRGVVIKKDADQVILENPGSIRTGKEQMLRGGISDPRNKTLLKMFNIIGIGERAGSGVPDIYAVWDKEGWTAPKIEEQYGPDRTILTLGFLPKPTIKTDDKKPTIKTDGKKSAVKSDIKKDMIREYLKDKDSAKTADIAVAIGLGITRTKELIYDMPDVEALGGNRNRTYRLKQ